MEDVEFTPTEKDAHTMNSIVTGLTQQKLGLIRAKRKSDGHVVTLVTVMLGKDRILPLAELLDNDTVRNYMPAVQDKATGETRFEEPEEYAEQVNPHTLETRGSQRIYKH